MSVETIFWCGVGYMLLAKSQQAAQQQQSIKAKMRDPTNWGADQWARLYGDDIAQVGGQPDAQATLTPYGLNGCFGFIGSPAR